MEQCTNDAVIAVGSVVVKDIVIELFRTAEQTKVFSKYLNISMNLFASQEVLGPDRFTPGQETSYNRL